MEDTGKKLTMVEREESLSNVEELMLKGMFQPSRIAKMINCSVPTATEYMKAIKKRWELANEKAIFEIRDEVLEKSRRLEEAYWEAFDKADNGSSRVGALNGLQEVHKYQSAISGWSNVLIKKN